MQASKSIINDIVKIKENFPNISTKKIKEVYNIMNNTKKERPRINMTIKDFSRRQVITSMSLINTKRIMAMSKKHVVNINKALKTSNQKS